jgi:hypothetical protein
MPNAHQAIIAEEKLRTYLLNLSHRRGGGKARILATIGFFEHNWQDLADAIRRDHLGQEPKETLPTQYGDRYEIAAQITGPNGRSVSFCTIWQIDVGTDCPRLITMYPE